MTAYPNQLPDDPFWQADLTEAQANADHFQEPLDAVEYADYRYVGTHNAFAYERFFQIVRQQDQSIISQLHFGVRGLMLDTYDWVPPSNEAEKRGPGDVVLSHPDLGFTSRAQKGHASYQTLKYELRRVVEFMKVHPKAVITVILEDYANATTTANEIKSVITDAGLASDDLIFRPSDLNAGAFRTLGWMRQNNRRLVIFTQYAANTDVTFQQFDYCYENKYGTSDENDLCTRVPSSPPSAVAILDGRSMHIVCQKYLGIFPPARRLPWCDHPGAAAAFPNRSLVHARRVCGPARRWTS